ncbi:MAG: hypothetical protein JWO57_1206 [Pseudonocardiales bacterium]|nr:hypothetical protein [Pseudonocardiales bacterium]
MPRWVSQAEAVAEAARIASASPSRPVWIGVDGPGGAGKSTLARRIADSIAGAVVVSVDDFSGPRFQAWDWDRFDEQLARPLRAGRGGRYQVWDWDRDEGREWVDVRADSIVVLEGVSAIRTEVDVPWGLTIWVEAPRDVRLARALARDGAPMMARWLEHWIPSEEAYIAVQRPQDRADLVVSGIEDA